MDDKYTSIDYYYGEYIGKNGEYEFKVRTEYESMDAGNGKSVANNTNIVEITFDIDERLLEKQEPDIPIRDIKGKIKSFIKTWLFDKEEKND